MNIYFDGTKSVARFTACPASTQQEKTLNDRVSITGNSLFLRNVHGPEENITLNICDEPVEPTMLYNTKSHMYEIGYEVWYNQYTVLLSLRVSVLLSGFSYSFFMREISSSGRMELIHITFIDQ